ncbi:hypothetical protein [Nostoc commune]|nr:hypothetical protein [Nostoc commune]
MSKARVENPDHKRSPGFSLNGIKQDNFFSLCCLNHNPKIVL